MGSINAFLDGLKRVSRRRGEPVVVSAMGKERVFEAFEKNQDTYILEQGIENSIDSRPSVLIVHKGALKKGERGWVMTIATGNHSVSAFPLLDGRFWKLSALPSEKRGATLMNDVICANIVNRRFELSQRDVSTEKLIAADSWLQTKANLPIDAVTMVERNIQTLEYYRTLGQDWRVKPLAWSEKEIKVALAASRRSIQSKLVYYHSFRGIHFLSFDDFKLLEELACDDVDAFLVALKELVGVFDGSKVSFTRLHRHRAHHEIELFGMAPGVSHEHLIPKLELLAEDVVLGRASQLSIVQRIHEIVSLYKKLLIRPELASPASKTFLETMYMYITGEVYSASGEGLTPAFDDRRTALPGATFTGENINFHPGADERTIMLFKNLKSLLSKDEIVEYANVYELLGEDEDSPIGKGSTREISFKTNRRPLERALIEKALSRSSKGYAGYMLSRVEVFRALGVRIGTYRVLRRHSDLAGKEYFDFYVRNRREGEPLEAIPAHYFRKADDSSAEDDEIVKDISLLMGDAAAQNMAMKKFDPKTKAPLFGIGKEIYAFEYDVRRGRSVPKKVSICSIRGTMGWPNISLTEKNFVSMLDFYLGHYASVLISFASEHTVPVEDLADRFLDGFVARTEALEWKCSMLADRFLHFKPVLPKIYNFNGKWRFAMWALKNQRKSLPLISKKFKEFVRKKMIYESLCDNSK